MKNKGKWIIAILLFASLSFLTYGQNDSSLSNWRCNLFLEGGFGGSIAKFDNSDVGFSYYLGGVLNYNNNLFSVRYTNNIEFILFTNPAERASSTDFLLGRAFEFSSSGKLLPVILPEDIFLKTGYIYSLNISAGISRTGVVTRKDLIYHEILDLRYSSEKVYTIGYPIELEFIIKNKLNLAGGFRFFANLNKYRNVYGFNLSIHQKIF